MLELGVDNVVDWLRACGWIPAECPARADVLSGGVSNVVLRVRPEDRADFVVKQSRERLRTEAAWFSRLDRIWREADVMRDLQPLTPPGFVPGVLFEDRENFAFAMQAAPDSHIVWKSELLAGRFDAGIACRLGAATRRIHRATAGSGGRVFRERYGDREVFEQLRIDPFYRRVAARHADLRDRIGTLIDQTLSTSLCLVHGDLSPKNLLVTRPSGGSDTHPDAPAELTLVDYEVAHYGDPAFDLGFLMSHLLLKAVHHAERCREVTGLTRAVWHEYTSHANDDAMADIDAEAEAALAAPAIERRILPHLAACMLARIDGTSRIDYLPEPAQQEFVRSFARRLLLEPIDSINDVLERLEQHLEYPWPPDP